MNTNYKAKVCAYTLGCKVNQYDTNAMLELLKDAGFAIVNWGERADIFLINTCTVTNIADKKSRNAISQARSINRDSKIIICGCLAQSAANELLKMPNVNAVIGNDKRLKIIEAAEACLNSSKFNKVSGLINTEYEPLMITGTTGRTRAQIKVQEGCANFCSYCIIPYVRGAPRSRPLKDAVSEAEKLVANNVKELVITGINLTSYLDNEGNGFVELISKIAGHVAGARVRLGSLDVYNLKEEDLIKLSDIENLCPHFHISLQSGSTDVLNRMGRKYTAYEYEGYIDKIRNYWQNPAITTDIITGFPQESDAEFEETVNFVKNISFSRLHVFPYSERKGTKAAHMDGAIPKALRKERAKVLIELGKKCEYNYIDSMIGQNAEILFERRTHNGLIGYSERYIQTVCREGIPGDITKVKLTGREENIAFAEPIN